MTQLVGVNTEKIEKLTVDITFYADRIKDILNQISDVVEGTKDFYDADGINEFRKDFRLYKDKFVTINKNVLSYIDDMVNVASKYTDRDVMIGDAISIANKNHV